MDMFEIENLVPSPVALLTLTWHFITNRIVCSNLVIVATCSLLSVKLSGTKFIRKIVIEQISAYMKK